MVGQTLGSASACDESYDGKEVWLTVTELLWSLLVQCNVSSSQQADL